MNEVIWPECTTPNGMLQFLRSVSDRKLRLFACACYRRLWARNSSAEKAWIVLDTSEQYADGLASKKELHRLRKSHPDERMAIANAFDAARITSDYCVNLIWDSIGGDNYRSSDYKIYSQEKQAQCQLLRDIFGNPFRPIVVDPSWLTSTAVAIAQGTYDDKAFDRLPILADALQDAGCENEDILTHLRSDGPHVKGCWALDLVLGKE